MKSIRLITLNYLFKDKIIFIVMSELFTTAKCWECKKTYIFGLCVFILLNITGICSIIALLDSQETPFTFSLVFVSAVIFRCICIGCNNKTEEEISFYEGFEQYN